MLSSSIPTYGLIIIIAVVAVQYGFAIFCLLKLAYLDISKKQYALWNVFILLVFFIGGIVFLAYWSKVKDKKTIQPFAPPASENVENKSDDETPETDNAEAPENDDKAENA